MASYTRFDNNSDTRGQNWYMEMACEARGAEDVNSGEALGRWEPL